MWLSNARGCTGEAGNRRAKSLQPSELALRPRASPLGAGGAQRREGGGGSGERRLRRGSGLPPCHGFVRLPTPAPRASRGTVTAEAPRGATSGGVTFTASSERRAPPREYSRTALSWMERLLQEESRGRVGGWLPPAPEEERGGAGWSREAGAGHWRPTSAEGGREPGGKRWGAAWSPPQTGWPPQPPRAGQTRCGRCSRLGCRPTRGTAKVGARFRWVSRPAAGGGGGGRLWSTSFVRESEPGQRFDSR